MTGPGSDAGGLRASDGDRERTAAILAAHATAGRLEPAECAERLAAAFAARTMGELYALTADLPHPDAVVPVRAGERPESLFARWAHLRSRK